MDNHARIGLIIPSANRLTEPQFNQYAPADVDIHVTRVRMTGKFHKPLDELQGAIEEAAGALSDTSPDVIVFHCTANSMEGGLAGEERITEWVGRASGCEAVTTSRAITEALNELAIRRLVLISPYVEATNQKELRYMTEAGFDVIHELGLGLPSSDDYIAVTPEEWLDITCDNSRSGGRGLLPELHQHAHDRDHRSGGEPPRPSGGVQQPGRPVGLSSADGPLAGDPGARPAVHRRGEDGLSARIGRLRTCGHGRVSTKAEPYTETVIPAKFGNLSAGLEL